MIISDQEVSWAYLLGPCFQLQNTKGIPLTGGYIEVYIHGTRDKYYCASDFAGTLHPFQIPLDSLGSNIVLASPEQAYDVYVYNRFGSLIMSRYNVIPVNGTSEGGGGTSNISITSSDGTITVTDTLDPETGIKTYDLSVPWASGDASYWHSRGASNQGQIISDTDTHVLLISEHAIDHEGEDITVGSDGKFHLKEGVYFWTVNVDLYSDSISNNTQQIYINSNINRASYKMDMTRDNQHSVSFSGITVATQDDYQEGFTIKTEGQPIRAGIYEVAIHKLNPKVLGTKYDAGYGIVIEDDTISVDPEVIPSVSTVSGMIQEAVTSIQPGEIYTAGEYIKIEDNEISVTGLQPAGDYLTSEDLEGYATETYVTTYVDNSVSSFTTEQEVTTLIQEAITAIAPEPELPLVAGDGITITEYEDRVEIAANVTSIDGYATESFVTGYVDNSVSSFVTEEQVTAMLPDTEEVQFEELDITQFAQASAIPVVTGFATHTEVYEAIVTGVQAATGEIPDVSDFTTHAEVYDTAVTAIQLVTGLIPDISDLTTHTEVHEATVTAIEAATAVIPDTEEVEFEEIDLNDYALASAIPDVSEFTTHTEVYEATVTAVQVATGAIPELPEEEEVEFEEINLSDYALASAIPVVTGYATHDEVHESIVSAVEYVTGIIPEAQVQSNWTETDNEDPSYIQNKPNELPLVAGDGITITEDLDHITIAANVTSIDGYATIEDVYNATVTAVQTATGLIPDVSDFTTHAEVYDTAVTAIQLVTGMIPDDYTTHTEVHEATVTAIEAATAVIPDTEEVQFEELDITQFAQASAITGFVTEADLIESVSSVTGIGDYGQFYSTNITGAATMSRTKGTIEVTNDGKIKLKKGQSYHVTVRGVYNQTSPTNVYGDVSYIEYITGQSIHVNVDKTTTDSQYFEISYDIYKLNNDSDYYVFLSINGGTVNDLFIEIHAIGSVGVGGSGGGGGTEYDAGWGIQILNNVISVNPSIIPVVTGFATKEELQDGLELVTGLIPDVSDFTTETQVTALIQEAVTSIGPGTTYTAGDYISIDNNEISVTGTEDLTMKNLTAGEGITISESDGNIVISASVTSVSGYVTDEELQDAVELVTGLIPTVQLNGNDQVTAINNYPIAGGSGSSYTAGNGIDITNNVISVDNTVALKTDIPDVSNLATKAELQDGLELVTGLIPDVSDYATHDEVFESSVTAIQMVTGLIPEAQVQSDWTEADNTDPAYILNKPSEKSLVAGEGIAITVDGTDVVISASVTSVSGYVTDEELQDAVELVTGMIPEYTAGDNIDITNDVISVTGTEDLTLMNLTAGEGITITESGDNIVISANVTGTPVVTGYVTDEELQDAIELVTGMIPEAQVQSDWAVTAVDNPAYIQNKPTEKNLIAGANVTITESNDEVTIETTEIASGLQLVAGAGITLTVSGNQLIIGLA